MTTRQISRLIIGMTVSTLTMVLLFSGSTASAGKGDRSAPTVPANLAVTAISETTASLSWQGSTDNSGKLSYRVRITNLSNSAYNSLATVGQTQTTYIARYLTTNTNYTFSVYAVDDSGNRSADSNTASVRTLADTTAPTGPVLQAIVLSPSRVQLTWTKSTDNVNYNCCSYTINMNGSPLTQNVNWIYEPQPDKLSVIVRHLQPGSANSFSVTAAEYSGGHWVNSNTVNAATPPSNDSLPPSAPGNLHLAFDNSCGELWLGWSESSDNADSQDSLEYEIYVNGVLSPLPINSGLDLDFVYATAFGDNTFTVKAVDRSGNSSAASAALKLFAWPC